MARTYSALFKSSKPDSNGYIRSRHDGEWSVIYKDDDDDCWYVELEDAENIETAHKIAEALNLREREIERPSIG